MVAVGGKSGAFLGWVASHGIETSFDLAHRDDAGRYAISNQDISENQDSKLISTSVPALDTLARNINMGAFSYESRCSLLPSQHFVSR